MNYEYVMTSDGELYHYGVKGMRWGHRKAQQYEAKAQRNRTMAGMNREASRTSSGLLKKTLDINTNYYQKKADKYEAKAAKLNKQVSNTRKAIKDYRNKWDDAEKAENDADAKWASVKEQYKALGKNRISRMLNAGGKSDAANKYRKAWDEAEEASNIADTKWNEVSEAYKKTGRNRVEAIINNIEYDRERKRK